MGTQYAVEHFLKAYNWDAQTRNFVLSQTPGKIEVVEFDYKGENQVVYQENGVTIRSWPAIHAGDGPVSFSLEWNGLKVVFGADTFPNKWFMEYAKDADVAMNANNRWIHAESSHFAVDFISFCGRCGILNSFAMRLGYFLHLFLFSCSSRRTSCMSMAANRSARFLLPLSKMAT